ncbi:hypothetical protein D0T50_11740 [Bacteroides sp. 214]|uniref:MscL family protein n=1 Tax=Bacteroides sp. 214 TaxID=2302935 RepID=UPI0013D48768|nr:MscL family protein [Bacteroides sp. 214]NDW13556.1 hypothetical protein [Bacteroides sp. 214]
MGESILSTVLFIGFIIIMVVRTLNKKADELEAQQKAASPDDIEMEYETFEAEPEVKVPEQTLPIETLVSSHSVRQQKTKKHSVPTPREQEPHPREEFDITSIDEVRRGIIWSEILKRKY